MVDDPRIAEPRKVLYEDEPDYPSIHDIAAFFGILAAVVVSLTLLAIAYQTTFVQPRIEAAADTAIRQVQTLRAQRDSAAAAAVVGPQRQDTTGAVGGATQAPAEPEGPPEWVVKAIQALAILICLGAWNTAWECILIAVAMLVAAGLLYVVSTKVIPRIKDKCKKKKKSGLFGWIFRIFCWLVFILDIIIKILIVVLFVVGMYLLITCTIDLFYAGGCLIGLIPEVGGQGTIR